MLIAMPLSIHTGMFPFCFNNAQSKVIGGMRKWQDQEDKHILWKLI